MQFVGQRIVDGLDRGVGQQILIGAVGALDAEPLRQPRAPSRGRAKRSRQCRKVRSSASPESPFPWRSWRRPARPTSLCATRPPLRTAGNRPDYGFGPGARPSACRASIQPGYSGRFALTASSVAISSAAERQIGGGEIVVELLNGLRPDDDAHDALALQEPGERDARDGGFMRPGDRRHRVDDVVGALLVDGREIEDGAAQVVVAPSGAGEFARTGSRRRAGSTP